MGQAKWRIPHVRFVRDVSHENARHFDAKEIQRVYRPFGWRIGTGSNWKLKLMEFILKPVGAILILSGDNLLRDSGFRSCAK